MGISDRDRSADVPIATRIAAADALGKAGDPRIDFHHLECWITIPAGKFLMGAQKTNPKEANYQKSQVLTKCGLKR